MRFTLGITTRYIDRHPNASMTNNPLVGNHVKQLTRSKHEAHGGEDNQLATSTDP
jgi:hypothetical protein